MSSTSDYTPPDLLFGNRIPLIKSEPYTTQQGFAVVSAVQVFSFEECFESGAVHLSRPPAIHIPTKHL